MQRRLLECSDASIGQLVDVKLSDFKEEYLTKKTTMRLLLTREYGAFISSSF